MKNVYQIGSGDLTFDIIERIINENLKLELAPEAKDRIQKCRNYLDRKIKESDVPLYGITTGFGSLCNRNISSDELSTLQENLVKSHACSVGAEMPHVIVKLMFLLKAHALSLGHSGVQVITVQRIIDFFNNDVMPIVYDRGSLGASGDLAPLANLFLPLMFAFGVGAHGNRTLGTASIGGMLIGMICQIFIVPVLFVIFQYLQEKVKPMEWEDIDNTDAVTEIEQYAK